MCNSITTIGKLSAAGTNLWQRELTVTVLALATTAPAPSLMILNVVLYPCRGTKRHNAVLQFQHQQLFALYSLYDTALLGETRGDGDWAAGRAEDTTRQEAGTCR